MWLVYATVAGVAALALPLVPAGGGRTGLALAVGASAVAAVLVGIVRNRPTYELPWVVLAIGLVTFFAGDLFAPVGGATADGTPGWADIVHLTAYACLAAALLLVHRRRASVGEWAGLVDAAVIATTAALGYWVFVVDLRAEDGAGVQLMAAIYLLLDIVLLALLTRLVVAELRQPSLSLAASAVAVLLATDVLALGQSVVARSAADAPLHAGWLLSSCLWGAAALHPSMRTLAERSAPREAPDVATVRLVLLGAVVLIPPSLIGLQAGRDDYTDFGALIAGLLVLVLLVLTRVGLLMNSVSSKAERERTLRAAAAAFVVAGDRHRIRSAGLDAAALLLGKPLIAARIVDVAPSGSTLRDPSAVVSAGDGTEVRVAGRSLENRLWPLAREGAAVSEISVEDLAPDDLRDLDLVGVTGHLVVRPVRVNADLLALLVLVTATRVSPAMVTTIDTLVAQLALALESASLSDELHLRQGEARFRALVQNSSDAILLIDGAGRVTYQSPATQRVLGAAPDELIGSDLADLSHVEDLAHLRSNLTEVLSRAGLSRRLELRLRRRGGSFVDIEAVVHNLQSDPNVGATLVTLRDISERKQFELVLTHRAFHDELTGLANRALFADRVGHALRRRDRDGTSVAVLLLDLDDFKTVNDGLGHAAGDALLRAVAYRLDNLVRPGDTTARLGGDEFAMVLVDLPSEDGAILAVERIIGTLGDPLVIEGREVFVQASIGVAFAETDTAGPDELLRNADAAMYVVKTHSKGHYAIFQPHMHAAAVHRLDLRADLQRALDNSEFVLHYQPIVSMTTGRLTGVEALVRWQHPQRGLVGPDEFIPLAEETGLVVPLGLWVMDQACRQITAWARYDPALTMSINVSQRQLRRMEFGDEVSDVLARSGVDPARVNLEITESAVMTDVESTIERLRELKALGVRLAVDDFGTGYSSFSWLRQLPVDVLKIDKEFVDELGHRERSGFLVAAIIDLAHNLGLSTVAEGIERGSQLEHLRHMRCDLGQGFHTGRPMSAAAVVDLLSVERSRVS